MSLKAKIEAVIYASEEPVTLAQLIGLLGHEAQAELDHLDSAQHSLALDAAASEQEDAVHDPEELNREILTSPENSEPADEAETELAAVEENAAAEVAVSGPVETAETSGEPAVPVIAEKDEKVVAREEKARTARLREYFRGLLESLVADYATGDRGLEIREVAGGYRLATKPEYHDAVRGFVKSLKPPLKLSLQALETLAVVAYKQPVTAPEISEIRGVDSGGVLGSLLSRKLVSTAGRKQVIGRPILYKTTKDFLLRFGLKDINELPSIEEFEKMAGELAEQEEIPMEHHAPESAAEVEPERHTHATQADGSPDVTDDPLDDALDESAEAVDAIEAPEVPGETVADEAIVDGRVSGLPPQYDAEESVDSPEGDAAIQEDERLETKEG
jgi:segregation and condensation protein B